MDVSIFTKMEAQLQIREEGMVKNFGQYYNELKNGTDYTVRDPFVIKIVGLFC